MGVPGGYRAPALTPGQQSGAEDATAALQAILDGGGRLAIAAGHTVRFDGRLLLDAGSSIHLSAGARLLKNGAGLGIVNRAFTEAGKVNGSTVWGPGEISAADPSKTGDIFKLWGDHVTLQGFKTRLWNGGRCITLAGDHCTASDLSLTGGGGATNNGGVRFVGGRGFRGHNLEVESGDDCFQFVPAGNAADPLYDMDIEDGVYVGCWGRSTHAKLIVIAIQDDSGAAVVNMTSSVRNSGFYGISGEAHSSALVVQNLNSSGAVEDCYARDCSADMGSTLEVARGAEVVLSGLATGGGVKRLTIDRLAVRNARKRLLSIVGAVEGTHVRRLTGSRGSETPGLSVARMAGNDNRLIDCALDGAGAPAPVVDITGAGNTVEGSTLTGIANAQVGARVASGARHLLAGNTFRPAKGSTTAKAWRIDAAVSGARAHGSDVSALPVTAPFIDNGSGTLVGASALGSG